MNDPALTSAEALDARIPGRRLGAGQGRAWRHLLVQVFERPRVQDTLRLPAVPEPLLVWVLSGAARVEERELDGAWQMHAVTAGDFFLSCAARPYELRWRAQGKARFAVMHLYLGLPLLRRAALEAFGDGPLALEEVSGARDAVVSALLEPLRHELATPRAASAMLVQGVAQGLAAHLVRRYGHPGRVPPRGGLPAHKLQRVLEAMRARLERPFRLAPLARAAGLSEFHFCRAFRQSLGEPPSRHFVRLRMEHARRLLRESARPVTEIALETGYASASHFAQAFRREVGVSPSRYRDMGGDV